MNLLQISLLVFACFVAKGSALRCYNCTTSTLAPVVGCQSATLDSNLLIECPPGQGFCQKTEISTTVIIQFTQTTRGCSASELNFCGNVGVGSSCVRTCTTDGCNSAAVAKATVVMLLPVILPALLAYFG